MSSSNEIVFKPSPVQMQFLESKEDITFYGGSAGGGKTWAILVDNLQGVHDPQYFSMFFRTTTTEIDNGLWPEAKRMYEPFLRDPNGKWIGKSRINEKNKTITFPSGARTKFSYLEYDKHADSHFGSEITMIYFDELQFRSYYQFDILRSRNRSAAKTHVGIKCTFNPDRNHWMYEWIKPYLDDEGYPRKELSGEVRYFVIVDDRLYSDWDREKLIKDTIDPETGESKNPETYTYIPALLEDNEHVDAGYRDKLNSMSEAKRKQLLLGCWHVDEEDGMFFKREWLIKADKVPLGSIGVRAWDLAASEPTKEYPRPDYTASIMFWRCPQGDLCITGDYVGEAKDEDSNIYGRFRRRAGARDQLILRQAIHDGSEVAIVLPEDSGAAGKEAFLSKVRFFTGHGFRVLKDVSATKQSKLRKFEPFASAAEHGVIKIVESSFNTPETLEWFYTELEQFKGERSTGYRKDEAVDICASGFNTITSMRQVTVVSRNQMKPYTPTGDWVNRRIL